LELPGKAAAIASSTVNKKKEKKASKRQRPPSSIEDNRKAAAPLEAKRNKSEGDCVRNLLTKTVLKPSHLTETKSSEEIDNGGATNGNSIYQQIEPGVSAVDFYDAVTGERKKIPKLIDVVTAHRKEALAGIKIADWSSTDVAEFLELNGFAAYSEAFSKEVRFISIHIYYF